MKRCKLAVRAVVCGTWSIAIPAWAAGVPAERRVPIDIPKAVSAVVVDGVLDEPAWQAAARTVLEYESAPGDGVPAPVLTEAFVTYDDEQLYVAFIAHDPDPANIRAHFSDRDNVAEDDFVGVAVDTFNDERRGFKFFVNPLGVQADYFQDDIRLMEDPSFDAIWESAGRIAEPGYIVEIAIPFRSLRFRESDGAQVWGVEFLRKYPRDELHHFRAYRANRNLPCYLCEFQKYRGFAGIDAGANVELTPTVTAIGSRARTEYGDPFGEREIDVEPGIDLRWGITPNVILNATLNPDFSQVEADSAQLDINNQFALFYDERRPFFLEGQDLFIDELGLVHTRNVADPGYGAKVTAKEGRHAFGAFAADDEITTLIFPGSQGNALGSFDFASRNAAARYRHDLGASAAVGGLLTRREGAGYRNDVDAVDMFWRFTDSNRVNAEIARSTTYYPAAISAAYGQPEGEFSDTALHVSFDRTVRDYFLTADYTDVGEDFRSDLGFVPQAGYDKRRASGGYLWHGEEDAWYRQLKLEGEYHVTTGASGQELERDARSYFSYTGGLQSVFELGAIRRRQFYDGTLYDQSLRTAYGEVRPSGAVRVGISHHQGDAIDFANSRAGEVLFFDTWLDLRLGRHFAIGTKHLYQRLRVPQGRLFVERVLDLRATWQFDARASVRWVTQYRHITRDTTLYLDDVDAKSRGWANQVLFAYKVNPRTLLYAGVSNGFEAIDDDPFEDQMQTLFMKLSYAWQH